jgi:hypothetical protein
VRSLTVVFVFALASAAVAQEPAAAERVRVLVLEPSGDDIEDDDKRAIVGLIAAGLSQHAAFDVLSNADVQQLMALEEQKASVGGGPADLRHAHRHHRRRDGGLRRGQLPVARR